MKNLFCSKLLFVLFLILFLSLFLFKLSLPVNVCAISTPINQEFPVDVNTSSVLKELKVSQQNPDIDNKLLLSKDIFGYVSSTKIKDSEHFNEIYTKPLFVEGELIIKYKSSYIELNSKTLGKKEEIFLKGKGLQKKNSMLKANASLVSITDGKSVNEKMAELSKNPTVEYVQPNFIYYPNTISTNDPYRNELWGLHNTGQRVNGVYGTVDKDIDAPEAWLRSGGEGVIVAVIDDGVAYNHPDLINSMWDGSNCVNHDGDFLGDCLHGYDYESNDKNPYPNDYEDTHGTHIAGTIAATENNRKGLVGVAPDAKIMALKTNYNTFASVIAIYFAEENGAHIINASWGGSEEDMFLKQAINDFSGLFIAAAGNSAKNHDDGTTNHSYPCDYTLDNIICVAATNQHDNLVDFSDYGVVSVDVGAPGQNILSTVTYKTLIEEDFAEVPNMGIPVGWARLGDFNYWGSRFITDEDNNPYMYFLYGDVRKPYGANSFTHLISPTYNLSGSNAGRIKMDWLCDTPISTLGPDRMSITFSGDNGFTWHGGAWWDERVLDENPRSFRVPIYSHSVYLPDAVFDLSSTMLADRFKFALSWQTDGYDNDYWGCGVTNLRLYKKEQTYAHMEGTSMAAPHVSGVVALLLSYRPTLTIAEAKNAILTTGDLAPSLSGKTVTGRRVNAYNALVSVQGDIIESFKITYEGIEFPCIVSERTKTIKCSMPADIPKTNLAPTITLTGGSISPASGDSNNFFENTTYTFTKSGGAQELYTVEILNYFEVSSMYRSGRYLWSVPNTKFLTSGDYDGDGKTEIAAIYDYGNNDMGVLVFKPNGTSFDLSIWFRSGRNMWSVPRTRFVTSGDYDGDGKAEIAAIYDYGNSDMGILVFKSMSDAYSFDLFTWFRSGKNLWSVPNTRFVTSGDYDGDGNAEIAAVYDYGNSDMGILVFKSNLNTFNLSSWFRSGRYLWSVPSTRFVTSGDYNGDGKAEIGAVYDYGHSDMGILVFQSNLNTFNLSTWFRSGRYLWSVPNTRFVTSGDYDGDGKAEIGAVYDYGNSDMGMLVFKSNSNIFNLSSWFRSGRYLWSVPNTRFVTSGDYNGNGIEEVATMYDYGHSDMGILNFK